MHYDLIIVGGGPGGYTAAFEAAAKKLNTALIEEREIGGLGIFIVKKSMDKTSYERKDGKNIFSMGYSWA